MCIFKPPKKTDAVLQTILVVYYLLAYKRRKAAWQTRPVGYSAFNYLDLSVPMESMKIGMKQ